MKHTVSDSDLLRVISFIREGDARAAIDECEKLIEWVNGVEHDKFVERCVALRKRDRGQMIVVEAAE